VPGPCDRTNMTSDRLLPWETRLISIATGLGEDYLKTVVLHFSLPATHEEAGGSVAFHAITIALRRDFALTLGTDIWFPTSIDTSRLSHFLWLVHECAHVRQYAEAGKGRFLRTYLAEAIGTGSYVNIVAERKARLTADAMGTLLQRHGDLLRRIQACADVSEDLARDASDYQSEYVSILRSLAASGTYGDDLEVWAESPQA
jgi:hypothetical protein